MLDDHLVQKLEGVQARLEALDQKLSDPAVLAKPEQYTKLARERSEMAKVVNAYIEYKKVEAELTEARELARGDDTDMKELAREEVEELEPQIETLTDRIKLLLVPADPDDSRNTLLEIRAGTGGEEAALFAGDLFRMYSRYAERQGWKVEIMSRSESESGGIKEIVALVSGKEVYGKLRFEAGVHRVQRVPVTESQGRIHTSAATVAVLPEAQDVDVQIADKDLRIDIYRSSGPGGQSVNTTDSAVRVTHIPSGLVVICQDEKSQHKNKAQALKILKTRILEVEREKQHAEMQDQRKSLVGSGDRSEKIRTYNFPQDRLTDHRIGYTRHDLASVLDGDLDDLIMSLREHHQVERLRQEGIS
ncbi:MAG: peptide chain release factor 1 [Deltaproteobacteria bacterium]|nr:peptide chain release factor 1 [Deltaproteobacteria bacterium]